MCRPARRRWSCCQWALAASLILPGAVVGAVSHGFHVPDGFEVSLFAGDNLAHDIYAMTTDHEGLIVVASRGRVKVLHDTDGDGRADQATVFAEFPKSGAQGMYFDDQGLVVSGDQGIRRWRDHDGDGKADGEPELFFRIASGGEHGAHGIVKGPDGWFYLVAGNEAGVGVEHAKLPASPVKRVTAGAIVRFSPDGKRSEVVAHGFRNPYDLDFHPFGEILTFDSDGERDHHLPWYAGTRIFDVAIGAEHGWILKGSPHAWSRPESWFDNTARLWTVGRGSPTGVVVYRHRAFPEHYHGGVFTACWTMGRIYFSPLAREGSTFRAGLETFMEAVGTNGFAPVDAVVGPSGDLFIAIGGRGTLGSVFRVRYTGAQVLPIRDPLRQVLAADQPLASWSRAKWVPQAKRLGARVFEQAAANATLPLPERIRAIEVLVEVFAGLHHDVARMLIRGDEPELLARVAWAVPRSAEIPNPRRLLAQLTRSDDTRIARAAWEALLSIVSDDSRANQSHATTDILPDWYRGFDADDRRVRAAAILAARETDFALFVATPLPLNPTDRQRLGQLKVFGHERSEAPGWVTHYFNTCVSVFSAATRREVKFDALRLLQLGLGDVSPAPKNSDRDDGLVGATTDQIPVSLRAQIVERLAPAFPTGDVDLDRELARLLAVLTADASGLLERVTANLTGTSAVEDDVYYLMVAARLPGSRTLETTRRIAQAVAGLHHKMLADKKEPSRYWGMHVGSMFTRLAERDPALYPALLAAPNFNLPDHALFAGKFPAAQKIVAARVLLAPSSASRDVAGIAVASPFAAWTREFVDLVSVLPDAELFPVLRAASSVASLHDPLALVLARNPQPEDRDRFVAALSSFQPPVVERAAGSLLKLSGKGSPPEIAAAISSLRRHCQLPKEKTARGALTGLLAGWSGKDFSITERAGTDLLSSYSPWFEWFARMQPPAGKTRLGDGESFTAWAPRLAAVNWDAGDAARGRRIYEERLCLRCHGSSRIGPDLVGITSRFSRDDLLTAVIEPSRDISPQWQGMEFRTQNGTTHVGVVVYESPTAKLIQTGPDTTIRLAGDEMVSVQPSRVSLMPPGLLNGLNDGELADFYAFMKTLKK